MNELIVLINRKKGHIEGRIEMIQFIFIITGHPCFWVKEKVKKTFIEGCQWPKALFGHRKLGKREDLNLVSIQQNKSRKKRQPVSIEMYPCYFCFCLNCPWKNDSGVERKKEREREKESERRWSKMEALTFFLP